jgi:hypothetical protein
MKTRSIPVALIALLLVLPVLTSAKIVRLPVPQAWQHKDTNMWCNVCQAGVVHPVNHAAPPGCAHCGCYCAPGAISMYAQYRGRMGVLIQQDNIYDMGKFTLGEIRGNGVLETHGVGMFDVPPPNGPGAEVQTAFTFAVGAPFQWGLVHLGGVPMTGAFVILCIDDNIPLLWCDHYNWPLDMYPAPDPSDDEIMGHCKIIAGYDDKDTVAVNDDDYYIYDPWPTSGSPYWQASITVLDNRDVYLADNDPVATEGSTWGAVKNLYR